MYFQVCIQTHTHVIQMFLLCHQDSYDQYDKVRYHQNQIQYFHALPSQDLFFDFHAGFFYQLHC